MPEFVREIMGRFGYDYDKSGFQNFLADSENGIRKLRGLATGFVQTAKAQRELNTKQLAAESKQLAIENKKVALVNKELSAENKKAALANKEVANEIKRVTLESKQLRLAQQKLKAERYSEELEKQKKTASGLSGALNGVKDSLIALGVVSAAKGLFGIALKSEQAVLRIKNLIDKTALAGLEKRFQTLNKQSGQIFSVSDFEQSAAAVFAIDRSTRFFAKSMDFAIKKAPVLGKSLKEIQLGLAQARVMSDEQALIDLGLVTPLGMEERRRRTGIPFAELVPQERTNFILNLLKLTPKQLKEADRAAQGLGASWGRFTVLIDKGGRALSSDFKPVMIFLLNAATKLFRMLAASPIGLFVLRLGGLIAGVATLALGLGALSKVVLFLKGAMKLLNIQTLLLMGKYLLIGTIIVGLIVLLDDLWIAVFGPKNANTITGRLIKILKKFFKDIGFDDFVKSVDDWLNNIVGKSINTLTEIAAQIKQFFTKDLGAELNKFFENLGFTDLTARIDKFLKETFDKFFNTFGKVKKILKDIGIGPGAEKSAFSFLPEAGEDYSFINTSRFNDLASLIGGNLNAPGFNLTPPGRQLVTPSQSISQIDQSTSLSFGNRNLTIQAGLNSQEIINAAVEEYRRDLEQQLNEADIGAQ